uniref:Putative metalloproteinase inhibitor 3 n=1 Tax=Corethrella appendiculata TaxID=1370023 RepID=U5EKP2_9DIPT
MKTIHIYKLLTVVLIFGLDLLSQFKSTEACSCMPEHSQAAYCKSDYVIVARVLRRSNRKHQNNYVYKIDIRKAYKMNPAAERYLKQGRIMTPIDDSACGIKLEIGQLYVFAGSDYHVNLCSFVRKYADLTIVEKRGIAGSYRKGCTCKIKPCFSTICHQSIGTCNWTPWRKCESDYGACIPSRGYYTPEGTPYKCHWRRSPPYNECLENP